MGELREILRLNHHFHSGSDLIMWVPSNLPKEFVPIGNIKPSDEESSLDCGSYGDLNSITCQPLTQWLWDNDRQAVYEKDEIEEREREGVAQRDSEVRSNYLDHLTLESYSSETPLPNWSGHVDTQIVRRGRKIIRSTVKRLIGLGRNASKANKIDLLTTCMRDLIDLDVRYIDTESRYEVFDDIEALAHACGVPEEAVKIYANRNW